MARSGHILAGTHVHEQIGGNNDNAANNDGNGPNAAAINVLHTVKTLGLESGERTDCQRPAERP